MRLGVWLMKWNVARRLSVMERESVTSSPIRLCNTVLRAQA